MRSQAALFTLVTASCTAGLLCAKDQQPVKPQRPPAPQSKVERGDNRRFYFGGRIGILALAPIPGNTLDRSTTSPEFHWKSTTEGTSSRLGAGPSAGVRITPRYSVGADWLFYKLKYVETLEYYSGSDSGDAVYVTESTRARVWDFPVLLRARDLPLLPWRRRSELLLGGSLRHVRSVKTGNRVLYPDDNGDYNERATIPSHRNLPGITAGYGFRYVDDYSFKLTPELRYTYWLGQTFERESIRTRRHQLEVVIGITF